MLSLVVIPSGSEESFSTLRLMADHYRLVGEIDKLRGGSLCCARLISKR
jgi:hypothetical protein